MSRWRQIVRGIAIVANGSMVAVLMFMSVQQVPVEPKPAGDDWSFLIAFLLVPLVSLGALIWQPRHRD